MMFGGRSAEQLRATFVEWAAECGSAEWAHRTPTLAHCSGLRRGSARRTVQLLYQYMYNMYTIEIYIVHGYAV